MKKETENINETAQTAKHDPAVPADSTTPKQAQPVRNAVDEDPAVYLPTSRENLLDLADYLANQERALCDRTFTLTEAFLKKRGILKVPVVAFLEYHGIQCDCDLLRNIHLVPGLGDCQRQQSTKTAITPCAAEMPAKEDSSLDGIEVFDFRKNWQKVLPHLPTAEKALGCCMNGFLLETNQADHDYDPDLGPWYYEIGYTMRNRIFAMVDQAIASGEFKWKRPPDDGSKTTEMELDRLCEFSERFDPQPDTVEWYQLYDGAHWLVPWQMVLGQLMFPDLIWVAIFGDLRSVAGGMDHQGKLRIILDILGFEEKIVDEVFDDGWRKCPEQNPAFNVTMSPHILATMRNSSCSGDEAD